MTSFLIDDVVAVDAGSTTQALSIAEQRSIQHFLISHSHMDHTASLPFLIENIFGTNEMAVTIHSTHSVLGRLQKAVFNNDTWPDFTRIPNQLYPVVRFEKVKEGRSFVIPGLAGGDLEVSPIAVNHVVPTVGFLLRQGAGAVLFTSDTGPTERVWEVANATEDLRAVIVECSFPSEMEEVARVSLHLTPSLLQQELEKLHREVPVFLYHFKPPYVDRLREEIAALELHHSVRELEQDRTYTF